MKYLNIIRTSILSVFSVITLISSSAIATELTHASLIGRYTVEGEVFFQKIYANFKVFNATDFEFQRTYPDGKVDEICSGNYTFVARAFKGVATCPSDRATKMDFNVDFARNAQAEDLVKGTNVRITTSMAGGLRVNAYIKKY